LVQLGALCLVCFFGAPFLALLAGDAPTRPRSAARIAFSALQAGSAFLGGLLIVFGPAWAPFGPVDYTGRHQLVVTMFRTANAAGHILTGLVVSLVGAVAGLGVLGDVRRFSNRDYSK
jgi:hypothetical protein